MTVATMKGPALRASSRAGSRSSVTGCVSIATRLGSPRSPSPPRCSTECSTLDARVPSALHDHQQGMGAPLPLPSPCNTLNCAIVADDPKLKVNVHGRRPAGIFRKLHGDTAAKLPVFTCPNYQ